MQDRGKAAVQWQEFYRPARSRASLDCLQSVDLGGNDIATTDGDDRDIGKCEMGALALSCF